MSSFRDLSLPNSLLNALDDLGFDTPTPIQEKAYPVILSGKNVVGIAQTGTGKTLAYLLPLLQDIKYSEQISPRILIMVPTRELVVQVVEQVEAAAKYMTVRVMGAYGGTNIKTQKAAAAEGADILVATPRRLFDLVVSKAVSLKTVKKVVIDEVDVMLDLGFVYQVNSIFELLPEKRQNIMFSATMTEDIKGIIHDFFITPVNVSVAMSGTPLENIDQSAYPVRNFYTKANLLSHLLMNKEEFLKVLIFMPSKKYADMLQEILDESYGTELGVVHSNKNQNYRLRSIKHFNEGDYRILVTTDVMSRGLDLDGISHVINYDVPTFPENYIHRIGRTGRADQKGKSILFFTPKEEEAKLAIEVLMNYEIPVQEFPEEVEVIQQLTAEEKKKREVKKHPHRNSTLREPGASFHEKKEKNKKTNLGGSYRRKLKAKYKKPKTRGDKNQNQKRK